MDNKSSLEFQVRELNSRLEGLAVQLTDQLGRYLSEWYERTAEDQVSKEYSHSQSIKARLPNLKAEVKAAAGGMFDQVREALGASHLWVHRTGHDIVVMGVDSSGRALPRSFLDALEPFTSRQLGESLARFGYNPPHFPLMVSADIMKIMNEYISAVKELRSLQHKINTAGEETQKREVLDLWRKS